MSRSVYIVAGPNGAGKTAFARYFLPRYADCRNFINADLIAQGVSPFAPEAAAFRAGRLMLEEIQLHAERGADFGFETTLSGRSHLNSIRRLRIRGYRVSIFFLWLPDVEMAISRVATRVARGGHNVSHAIVRRRFGRSIRNFLQSYCSLADAWTLFYNSARTPRVIAFGNDGKLSIVNTQRYREIVGHYRGQ